MADPKPRADPRPRPNILAISAYVPGKSKLDAGATARAIKLSANEGALGASPKAIAAYRTAAEDIWRYPDGASSELRAAIGVRFALAPERIVCGCGSGDVLHLLAQAYAGPGDEVIHTAHGFLLYPIAARAADAVPVVAAERARTASIDEILARVSPRTKIVFLANPNNPTGTYVPAAELARLRAGLPDDILLVIDAAYCEYARAKDYSAGHELVEAGGNTVVSRTFSKFFGLAGLRLGWVHCPPAIADVLNRIRGPFNVALPTQLAAVAALEDREFQDAVRANNDKVLPWISAELSALGLDVTPSQANFILLNFPAGAAPGAKAANAHLDARGIIVRAVGAYGLPDSLRITIGTEAEMRAVRDAFAEFMR